MVTCSESRPSSLLGGTLRLSSLLTPERAVTRASHLGVSPHLPLAKEIYLLRDYRPTERVRFTRFGDRFTLISNNLSPKLGVRLQKGLVDPTTTRFTLKH